MAKLTITDAAHACHVARTTIQRAVKAGRLSLDADHMVDTAELLRVGYQLDAAALHAATQQDAARMQQNAAPPRSTPQYQTAAPYEVQLIRQERDALQRERDLLMQQVEMLRSMQQTTQQQLTQAQQMLHEMQHRYDRLLEAPRTALPASTPAPRGPAPTPRTPAPASGDPRGDMRRRIVALLQEHPEGLSAEDIRVYLKPEKPLGDTLQGMRKQQRVRTHGTGKALRYFAP